MEIIKLDKQEFCHECFKALKPVWSLRFENKKGINFLCIECLSQLAMQTSMFASSYMIKKAQEN